jgi:hypothetical protein
MKRGLFSPHERRLDDEAKGPSDRSFAMTFAIVFGVLALLPFVGAVPWLHLAAVPALACLVLACTRPAVLGPLNRLWTRFGALLHLVMQPIVMGLIFFGVITPFALIRRVFHRDPLRLRLNPAAASYWISRREGEPAPETMKDQF